MEKRRYIGSAEKDCYQRNNHNIPHKLFRYVTIYGIILMLWNNPKPGRSIKKQRI